MTDENTQFVMSGKISVGFYVQHYAPDNEKKVYRTYGAFFCKGDRVFAKIAWHHAAGEFVLATSAESGIRLETVRQILPFMDLESFRRARRQWQKYVRCGNRMKKLTNEKMAYVANLEYYYDQDGKCSVKQR